jgi:hypothetical protein
MRVVLLIVLFTLLSGLGDALGFIYAGRVWQGGQFNAANALKSTAAFQAGVTMYWLALRHLEAQGVVAVEAQTLFWFGATVIGIAVLSRQFLRWPLPDQAVALAVLIGIGWLLHRTAT